MRLLSGHLLTSGALDQMMAPTEASYDTHGLSLATYYLRPREGLSRSASETTNDPQLPTLAERYLCQRQVDTAGSRRVEQPMT